MRVSNVAYAPAQIRLEELVFQGYWPYEHDAIGSMQDLDDAQLEWVRAFHDSYYAPNLAVLSIAGDFETDEAMQLVHRFFDTGKKQEKVIAYEPPAMPEQTEPRAARRSKTRTPRRRASSTGGPSRRTARPITTRSSSPGDPRRRRELAPPSEARARQGARARGVGLDRGPPRPRHVRDRGEARRRSAHRRHAEGDRRHHRRARQGWADRRRDDQGEKPHRVVVPVRSAIESAARQPARPIRGSSGAMRASSTPSRPTTSRSPKTTSNGSWPSTSSRLARPSSKSGPPAWSIRLARPRRRSTRGTENAPRRKGDQGQGQDGQRLALGKEKEGGKHKPKHKKEAP